MICRRPQCRQEFKPRRGWESQQRYCSPKCQHLWASECYRKRHPHRVKQSHANHYKANKRSVALSNFLWKYRNPDRVLTAAKNHAHRRRGLLGGGVVTSDQWLACIRRFNRRCVYCGRRKPLTQDHATPLSRGGAHHIDNILPACRSCNARKGARTYEEFTGDCNHYMLTSTSTSGKVRSNG